MSIGSRSPACWRSVVCFFVVLLLQHPLCFCDTSTATAESRTCDTRPEVSVERVVMENAQHSSAPRVLVIGSNGQVGKLLVKKLRDNNFITRAMVRDDSQRELLKQIGAHDVVVADLEGDFNVHLKDCDAVVFTAGSGAETGADKTLMVDLWGALKVIRAMENEALVEVESAEANMTRMPKRLIMVSAIKADDPERWAESLRPYLVAKHVADDLLRRSSLDFTIVRPGRLTNDEETGRVSIHVAPEDQGETITRADVAEVVLQCLLMPQTIRKTIDLVRGDVTIGEALQDA